MRPLDNDAYCTLGTNNESDPLGLTDAIAMVNDPETWLPPTSAQTLFRAWHTLLRREHEIHRLGTLLGPNGYNLHNASNDVLARVFTTINLPLRKDFETMLRVRAADDKDFVPFRVVEEGEYSFTSAVDELGLDTILDRSDALACLHVLASRLPKLERLRAQADARHTYLVAGTGSFLRVERADAEAALATVAAIDRVLERTQEELAEIERMAGTEDRLEAERRARVEAEDAAETLAMRERARQRAADVAATPENRYIDALAGTIFERFSPSCY